MTDLLRGHSFMGSLLCGLLAVATVRAADKELFFESDVRPIFKLHCFHCHGEEDKPEAALDLRLVRWISRGGDSGPAVVPGQHDDSLLLQRIEACEMPPKGAGLSDDEKRIVRDWIGQGARTRRPEPENLDGVSVWTEEELAYWAFQPPVRTELPAVSNAALARTPVDRFLLAELERAGLSYSEEADRATLARRLSFDLLGLPPTPEMLERFLTDDSPDAYERLVERLLASPAYGERWARHWLDTAGYADSDGYTETDSERPWAFRYRDYVIRSFNASKPLDEWIVEQLAGDELLTPPYENLDPGAQDKLIATGFLRMAPDGSEDPGVDAKLARNDVMAETIKIVSTSLLGMTVGCAQCHDHRYDPISQLDYYRFRAIFEPALDTANWRGKAARLVSIMPAADRELAAKVDRQLQELSERQTAELDCIVEEIFDREVRELPDELQAKAIEARQTAADKRSPEQTQLMKEHPSLNVDRGSAYLYDSARLNNFNQRWQDLRAKKQAERPADQAVACLTEVPGQVPPTHLFFRGDINQPRQAVEPSGLSVLQVRAEIPKDDEYVPTTGRRLALARHLTRGIHPLLTRTLVNRVWMHHFGRGIVNTPGDFGILGERPTHPALLDWLAIELVERGWDLKNLHRLLLNSTAYRQRSTQSDEEHARDPENRLLGRMPIRRLEAEAIRDAMIDVAGLRTKTMFGPPSPVNPDDVGQIIVGSATRDGNGIMVAKLSDDPEQYRRSIYVQARRSMPLGMLEPFDLAGMVPNCDRRSSSTVAPQALLLMNNQVALHIAERFAQRVIRDVGQDSAQQIAQAVRLAFGRQPTEADVASAMNFLKAQREYFENLRATEKAADTQAATPPTNPAQPPPGLSPSEQALALLCQALLSSNQFLYVD